VMTRFMFYECLVPKKKKRVVTYEEHSDWLATISSPAFSSHYVAESVAFLQEQQSHYQKC
jgi:hypothetical protein